METRRKSMRGVVKKKKEKIKTKIVHVHERLWVYTRRGGCFQRKKITNNCGGLRMEDFLLWDFLPGQFGIKEITFLPHHGNVRIQ